MRKIIDEFTINSYKVLILNDELPKKPYRKYVIDGVLFEPVSVYDASKCIAIESTETFVGKTVEFV